MNTITNRKGATGYLVEYRGHAYQQPVVTGIITPVTVERCGAKRMTLSQGSQMTRVAWPANQPIYATIEDAEKAADWLCCWYLAHNTERLLKQVESSRTMNERYHQACKRSLGFILKTSIKSIVNY